MDNLVATIKKLRIQIQKNEDYITYLEKEITTRDDEIDILRIQVNDLKIRLRKAEADALSNDKNISALELQLQDMSSEISSLQHRIYKLREGMSLTTPSTSTNVFTLIDETKTNIRVLFDSVREGLAPEYETEIGRLQTTINEQRDRIDELGNEAQNWYQRANQLQGRYDTVLDERDRYRTECFRHEETLRGIHENIAHEGADQLDLEDENAILKEEMRIAGLMIIALR
ncbi:23890_t:CDS:2, partial [Dentiscutata erythropus]